MKKLIVPLIILIVIFITGLIYLILYSPKKIRSEIISSVIPDSPTPTFIPSPPSKIIPIQKHVFQTFNNCGPASLSMALSYYGIDESQEELGKALRPYQIQNGDNDDKSVTLEEIAEYSKNYNLTPFLRPNGSIEKIKRITSLDLPIITRTWLKPDEDIGHFRIIRGYDDLSRTITQDDSLQYKNSTYSYEDFLTLWKPFNYEYLVLAPNDKIAEVEKILGEEADPKIAWSNSLKRIQEELKQDPNNSQLLFNLSINYYNLKEYQKSIDAYEQAEYSLPPRTLWYQIEPILAYQKVKNYEKIFEITDRIINNQNRAFSELYFIRGEVFEEQNEKELAAKEYEKAIFYNQNFQKAIDALKRVSEETETN